MSHTSILFEFPERRSAEIAFETLRELGYDPQLHEGNRLHIHVIREDLTSALEIVQSQGGRLIEQAPERTGEPIETMASVDYGLDSIPIPAHLVNEDWTEGGERQASTGGTLTPEDRLEAEVRQWDPDSGTYDTFEAR